MPLAPDAPLDSLVLDEPTRPKAPPIPGATEGQRRAGRHLAMIHAHHLRDLLGIGQLVELVAAGEAGAQHLPKALQDMELTENMALTGTLCGRECAVLTMHHDIEETSMFPHLDRVGDPGISAVVQRLKDEHEVVHALLLRLQGEAATLAEAPTETAMQAVRATYARLTEVVRSHFGYEETELQEALGVHGGL
ncbi:hemerythrin domain-containing protein [Wenxinia saemankumensis]|uniref:Hemerythrin HHE cation binding domain-containing protein n=1 Tax=Wenxinia saemankumensis TaxID=1447782 RepID=A0A1M6AH95_9RHOB|nr:hemerythrin domain-containing protein [Wenxinia saemankumensis]SHI35802.1 Hemerythrin HHE cation binding domain-containing protein [Wenxinia saemankumensis]